jgi:hypothetical protein
LLVQQRKPLIVVRNAYFKRYSGSMEITGQRIEALVAGFGRDLDADLAWCAMSL